MKTSVLGHCRTVRPFGSFFQRAAVTAIVMVYGWGAAFADEPYWPTFRGPDRSGISDSTGLLPEWPEGGPPLVWKTEGAGRGYASVSMADGRLFTMGDAPSTAEDEDEYLTCLDVATGRPLWQRRLGPAWDKGSPTWQSSRSTPTVDGKLVYALTAYGDLICLETATGNPRWRKNLREDLSGKKGDSWGYSESVLIDGQKLVCTPGGEQNTIVALDKDSGDMIWSASRKEDRGAGHASIVISQIAGTRVYVQTTASGALGVRADDGKLLWSYDIPKTTAVIPTPVVRDALVFFTAGYGLGGTLLRQVPAADDRIDVEEVYPPNRKLQNKHGGVILLGDYLYGDTDSRGQPFCVELKTGDIQWQERGSGRGSASLTAADGHLYIRFSNSIMVLAKVTPEEYVEVSSFEIPGASSRPSWSHPVIAGGQLFLREHDSVLCYDLRAKP